MALEPTKKMSLKQKLSTIDKIASDINEKSGKKLVGRIGADPEIADKLKIKFIPSKCLDFNRAVGGGYPRSRCTIISGSPDSGKSGRLLEDIGFNMKMDQKFISLWIESEKSLEQDYAINTFGIDPERFVFVEYDPDMGAEGVLDKLYAIMKAVPIDMVVINSLKCLTPKAIIDGDLDNKTPGVAARLNSIMAQKFTALVADSGSAFVIVTHTYAGIGTYMTPQVIAGGKAIQYWSALTLSFSKSVVKAGDPIKPEEGAHFIVTVKKNHCVLDRNPYVKFEYFVKFGIGTEMVASNFENLCELGIIEKTGNNYIFKDDKGKQLEKILGKSKAIEYLQNNSEVFEMLLRRARASKAVTSSIQSMTKEEIDEAKAEEIDTEEAIKAAESK